MQYIDQLIGSCQDQTAWIFGKGPSLDHFVMDEAGPTRICINESLRAVPNPTHFFSHDEGPIRNVADNWPSSCKAILQLVRAEYAERCGVPREALFVYEKRYADNTVRDMDQEAIAKHRALYGNSGTIHSAIHFCRLIGANHIVMVGCDGTGGYAQSIDLPVGGAEHERIRRDSVSLLEAMGMSYEFFQPVDSPAC